MLERIPLGVKSFYTCQGEDSVAPHAFAFRR
jgi:hypothetical protein